MRLGPRRVGRTCAVLDVGLEGYHVFLHLRSDQNTVCGAVFPWDTGETWFFAIFYCLAAFRRLWVTFTYERKPVSSLFR
jgi:hypothetical protein